MEFGNNFFVEGGKTENLVKENLRTRNVLGL